MDITLLTKLRQEITRYMPVVNYDKATINTAIEEVYGAFVNSTQLPDKGSFDTDQWDVIVGVIQAFINKSNEVPIQQPYMAESARLKIALSRSGLLTTVSQATVKASEEIHIWWEYAINFDMYDSRVQAMATALGITQEQLKQLWDLANSIE